MVRQYTQEEIDALIKCPKTISNNNPPRKAMALEKGHYRNGMDLQSLDGKNKFQVYMRKNAKFEENFTIGLDYIPADGSGRITLLRCNGPHGGHINTWEFESPHFGHHIHIAKADNINDGLKSDIYAEVTQKYSTYFDALFYFLKYCNIQGYEKYFTMIRQLRLFDSGADD